MTVIGVSILLNSITSGFLIQKYGIETIIEKAPEKLGLVQPASGSVKPETFVPPEIPEIYFEEKELLTMSFENNNITTKEDFMAWRNDLLEFRDKEKRLPEKMSQFSPNLSAAIMEQEDSHASSNVVLTRYSMNASDGDTIIFYEAMPKDKSRADESGRLPAVLIFPGTGNQGARDVLDMPSDLEQYYYHDGVGLAIANEGYAVYVIENRGWGLRAIETNNACPTWTERQQKIECSGVVLRLHLSRMGYSLTGFQIADGLQLLEYIKSLDYIDKDRIAVGGLSHGGGLAHSMALEDESIRSVFIASGTGALSKSPSVTASEGGSLEHYDLPDLLATLAPMHLYISFGTQEQSIFAYEVQTGYSYNYAKQAYALFDAEDNIMYVVHGGTHQFDIPSVLTFLDKTIG